MLNIRELEKRWFKYKIKSYLPSFMLIVLSILAIGVVIFLNTLPNTKDKKITKITKTIVKQKPVQIIKKVKPLIVQKHLPLPKKKKEEKEDYIKPLKLEPSLNFIKHIEHSVRASYTDIDTDVDNVKEESRTIQVPIQQKVQKPIKRVKIKIQIQNTKNDIKDIIKRFKKNNNPALSLFVAKKEYELKNYAQAYDYALITNNLNKNIEDSWIIFTKSLVKLGRKDQAISTLRQYIKHSHSNNAKLLLNEIISGKFI